MKYLIALVTVVLMGYNTFNGAVDGAQTMVVDTAKGVGSGSATAVEGIAKDIRSASE